MADGILRALNVVPGTGNPVKLDDLNILWSAIRALGRSITGGTKIASGFDVVGSQVGEGIIFFNDEVYYLPRNTLNVDEYIYAATQNIDVRELENGESNYTYTDFIINASSSNTETGLGVLIGQATIENLDEWKAAYVGDGTVSADQLEDGSIQTSKLANNAVTQSKIAQGAIGYDQLQSRSVGGQNIMVAAIEPINLMFPYPIYEAINDAPFAININFTSSSSVTPTIDTYTLYNIDSRYITSVDLARNSVTGNYVFTITTTLPSQSIIAGSVIGFLNGAAATSHYSILVSANPVITVNINFPTTDETLSSGALRITGVYKKPYSLPNPNFAPPTTQQLATSEEK